MTSRLPLWKAPDQPDPDLQPVMFVGETAASGYDDAAASAANARVTAGEDAAKVWRDTGYGRMEKEGSRFGEIDDSASRIRQAPVDGSDYRLEDLLDHPKLYAAYPDLKDRRVSVRKFGDRNTYAGTDADTGDLSLNSEALISGNLDYARKALLHEIQHAIQLKEGWPRGTNPTSEMTRDLDTVSTAREDWQRLNQRVAREPDMPADTRAGIEAEMKAKRTVADRDWHAADPGAAYEMYRTSKGEAQSFDTEARRRLNAPQRLARAPRALWGTP